ncbi:hypothetical protein [Bacillus sp. FJAT-49736]|uniref:hypothetical protein n=1 Tax=Bacillus sp. FJAT-49736 TaxID=2833582 RepID=UPI001BCA4832|nr:hypothetical protein [Bacillus sp. FJAT-49736]MBS4172951.1 hypothetical protein [Bacillus sp. FJAT-49736]
MNKRVLLYTFIVSFVLVLLSPFLFPVKVTSFSELKALRFGFPYPFIEQTSNIVPAREDFPITLTMLNPLKNVTQILLGNLALSVFNVMVLYLACWYLIKRIVMRKKRVVGRNMNS